MKFFTQKLKQTTTILKLLILLLIALKISQTYLYLDSAPKQQVILQNHHSCSLSQEGLETPLFLMRKNHYNNHTLNV